MSSGSYFPDAEVDELSPQLQKLFGKASEQLGFVPNVFTIELSETDYERLSEHGSELEDELIAAASAAPKGRDHAPPAG